jgi:hypothetical protein
VASLPSRIAAAAIVATVAFWSYTQTLLPGVDLGDTGGFQAAVLWPQVSARQSYPLYYSLAKPFVAATGADPARALNLFSALCAAVAVGLLAYFVATVTRSVPAGVLAALLLAFSYSFWSQAIIAEVYALHLALLAACLIALHHYAAAPTLWRLGLFFALYAVSFGNHLSMILLLPPFAAYLLMVTPRPASLFRPAVIALALAAAIGGALQYWPNLMAVVFSPDAPRSWLDQIAAFWFDATKADWREEMVLGIAGGQTVDRLRMWWFDARQQFGIVGLALAVVGAARLWRICRVWALTIVAAFAINTSFALTYNVGDSHVFFLPSHFLAALCAGAAVLAISPAARPRYASIAHVALSVALVAYAGWRGWSTWPAVDRHDDRRGEALVSRLTLGVADPDAMLVSQMNWQLENVLLYMGRTSRPELTWTRLGDVLPYFPLLVDDQHGIARDVVLTESAAADVLAAYGPLLTMIEDDTAPPGRTTRASARCRLRRPSWRAVRARPAHDTERRALRCERLRDGTDDAHRRTSSGSDAPRVRADRRNRGQRAGGLPRRRPSIYRVLPAEAGSHIGHGAGSHIGDTAGSYIGDEAGSSGDAAGRHSAGRAGGANG